MSFNKSKPGFEFLKFGNKSLFERTLSDISEEPVKDKTIENNNHCQLHLRVNSSSDADMKVDIVKNRFDVKIEVHGQQEVTYYSYLIPDNTRHDKISYFLINNELKAIFPKK